MSLRAQRPALLVLAVVALLAVGFALGAVARLPQSEAALSVPAADSVDVGFAQDMTVHHEQAVQMANQALTRSPDPIIQSLAFDIFTTQQRQIGQMQGWLDLWNASPLPVGGGFMGWMADGEHHSAAMVDVGPAPETNPDGSVTTMPGMASSEELAELRTATGDELDVLFLQLMLRHHQGGSGMLTYAAANAVQPVVRDFSATVAGTQRSEADYLTSLLAERGAQPLDG